MSEPQAIEHTGPAFPSEQGSTPEGTLNQTYDSGMSTREYASIHLRVPNSGLPWLDEMITESLRNEFAMSVLNGQESRSFNVTPVELAESVNAPEFEESQKRTIGNNARCYYRVADAMLAARTGGAK